MASSPLVSFVIAAHDAEPTLRLALASVLRQTVGDLEAIVVDDASSDGTPELLRSVPDTRLVVLRNDEQLGLAGSLNRGLERARGRWVARLDADDVAFPERLERQLDAVTTHRLGVVGSGVVELAGSRLGEVHLGPATPAAVEWRALFGAPFFHPTVLVDRELLERHDLRYDTTFGESEDYELWSRLLAHTSGGNVAEPLVVRRIHAGQASKRRSGLQRGLQRDVALQRILALAPELGDARAELAWRVGSGLGVATESSLEAAEAFAELYRAFARSSGARAAAARGVGARALARLVLAAPTQDRARVAALALRVDPALPLAVVTDRAVRRRRRADAHRRAETALALLEDERRPPASPVRVVVVSPEPTPYRSPLLDRVAERPEVDLTVVYAGCTVAGRTWDVEPRHRAVFLRGVHLPGAPRLLRHDYPLTPGIVPALLEARPEVVVASGWSTFASQVAIAWARARRVPYLLLVSSHERGERAGWRLAVRRAVVPRLVRGAAGALVLGTLSRESLVAQGADPRHVHVFANTVDVWEWGRRADELAQRREQLRAGLGAGVDDVLVLSVCRLVPEKGLDVLVRAAAEAGERASVVVAGSGPERDALTRLAAALGVRLTLVGDVGRERLQELYVAADVFALLSSWEPWGVVVNEAAACGLPLVLSDRVGAAPDLLRDGENGLLVPAGDVTAAAAALRRLASDPLFRRAAGARSRDLAQAWGYEPSVEAFVQAIRDAAAR